jgi:Trypsin-like peptidase domain
MFALLAAVLFATLSDASAADLSGVVGIYTSQGVQGGQGSGFLISSQGEILTAFHVIHGAQRIDVQWRGMLFSDVVVAKILPEFDLAILRIDHVPPGLTPLRLASGVSWRQGQPVRVVGYARGIPNQQFDGTITQQGEWKSEQIRDDQGRKLFRRDGIRLVPLDLTIYNGLSGGPVFSGDEVIGVVSGSLSTGRGIAWAIPVDYARQARLLGLRARQILPWPEFAMTRDWANVRSSFRLDNTAGTLLKEYFATLDEIPHVVDGQTHAAFVLLKAIEIVSVGRRPRTVGERRGFLLRAQPRRRQMLDQRLECVREDR